MRDVSLRPLGIGLVHDDLIESKFIEQVIAVGHRVVSHGTTNARPRKLLGKAGLTDSGSVNAKR